MYIHYSAPTRKATRLQCNVAVLLLLQRAELLHGSQPLFHSFTQAWLLTLSMHADHSIRASAVRVSASSNAAVISLQSVTCDGGFACNQRVLYPTHYADTAVIGPESIHNSYHQVRVPTGYVQSVYRTTWPPSFRTISTDYEDNCGDCRSFTPAKTRPLQRPNR